MAERKIELNVEGMTCGYCQSAVKGALENIPGVRNVVVDLEGGHAFIEGSADVQVLISAVEDEGYRATLDTQRAL